MSRRRRPGLAPSLFPFLAVLVCTLGTLILLLALVAKDAKESAEQVAQQQRQEMLQEVTEVAQQERWRAEELQNVRDQQTQVLEERRSELAHVEDHLRRVKRQLEALQSEIRSALVEDTDEAELKSKIEELTAEIEDKKESLEDLKERNAGRRPRVAIMPHRGPNGTQRRPIYLECSANQIVLQPEGVRITIDELRGPTGPGNPLDAALRTIRNYWESQGTSGSEPPYPLLIVRPDGIMAYTAARVSMTAWDDQFGYELVPADVELAFPKPDNVLAERTEKVVAESVRRRATMISAVPSRYRQGLSGSDPIGEAIDDATQRQATGFASRRSGNHPGQSPTGSGYSGGSGSGMQEPMQRWNQNLGSSIANSSDGSSNRFSAGTQQGQPGSPQQSASGSKLGQPNSSQQTGQYPPGTTGSNDSLSLSPPTGDGSNFGSPGAMQGPAGGNETGSDYGSSDTGAGTEADASGQSSDAAGGIAADGSAAAGQASAQQMGSGSDASSDPDAAQNASVSASVSASAPLSQQRGRGWAMRGSKGASDGPAVVRNVKVQCYGNRLVMIGDSTNDTDVILVDPADPSAAVVRLAGLVRQRVDNWGLALTGGRWQPVLQVAIAPGGEANFNQLNTLLHGSGIGVDGRSVR